MRERSLFNPGLPNITLYLFFYFLNEHLNAPVQSPSPGSVIRGDRFIRPFAVNLDASGVAQLRSYECCDSIGTLDRKLLIVFETVEGTERYIVGVANDSYWARLLVDDLRELI